MFVLGFMLHKNGFVGGALSVLLSIVKKEFFHCLNF